MNADSRAPGKGGKRPKPKAKRRTVATSAESVAKRPPEPLPIALRDESHLEPEPALDRAAIRELALNELAKVAVDVAKNIGLSAKSRKQRPRRSGQASADAKWVLETLLKHATPLASEQGGTQVLGADGSSQGGSGASVHDLADKRRELYNALRSHRRDLNK